MTGRYCLRALGPALIVLGLLSDSAAAAAPKLTVTFTPLSSRARVAAPIPGIWEIHYTGGELLEGDLHLSWNRYSNQQRVVITDVVVNPSGPTRFRGMLPAIEIAGFGYQDLAQAEMSVRFIARDGTEFPEELQQLILRSPARQAFSICVCDPRMDGGAAVDKLLEENLSFERLNPDPRDKSLQTAPAHVAPRDMPIEPLGYCAFDLVLLADEAYMETDEKSLDALAEWIAAGGSLLVWPTTTLDGPHLEFLKRAAQSAKSDIAFVTDAEGRLTPAGIEPGQEFALLQVGLGRVAVGLSPRTQTFDPESPAWRNMLSFVWRIAAPHHSAVERFGTLDTTKLPRQFRDGMGNIINLPPGAPGESGGMLGDMLATSRAQNWSESLVGMLMPRDFRFVPLWLIGGLLVAFVLVIGPIDYFLLGALKMRKLTWVLFPVTAFAFAYFTIWVANGYMGVTNQMHAIDIIDVGDDNSVVRSNRLELHYNGAGQHYETQIENGLFTALDTTGSDYGYSGEHGDNPKPLLVGRIPQQVTAIEDIPQWTPRLNRRFHIAPPADVAPPPQFDFDTVKFADFESNQSRSALGDRIRKAFGSQCMIRLLHEQRSDSIGYNRRLLENPYNGDGRIDRPSNRGAVINNVASPIRHYNGDQLILALSAPPPTGVAMAVWQVSPLGGWSFDDLAMMDRRDPRQWLLIVAVPAGEDVRIYRKLYISPSASAAVDSASTN